jgi:hypothetical protein
MGHIEDFKDLAEQETERFPNAIAGLRHAIKAHHIAPETGVNVLRWMQLDTPLPDTAQPHTSHDEPHLHIVGSEEAGTSYIDYGEVA